MAKKIDTTNLAGLEQWHEFRAELEQQTNVVTAPDGIKALGLPSRLSFALQDAGVLTIASVQRRVADDTIGDVSRIGKVREKVLREALTRWGRGRSEALGYRQC